MVLVTDGVANVGVTEKKDFLKLLEKHDVRLFSFVMGNSANRPLLQGMTTVSNGFSMSISNGDDIAGRLMQTAAKLSHEAYRDIDLRTRPFTESRAGFIQRWDRIALLAEGVFYQDLVENDDLGLVGQRGLGYL